MASFLVSAIQISCNARLALLCRLFGILFRMLAVLCTQQRCSRAVGHTSPSAFQNPSAPSATAICGAVVRPRYLQWHMRRSLAPMLFDEPDPAAREAQRTSPVAKAEPSPTARRKTAGKRTDPADGEPLPVHSFHTLLGDLATLTRNLVRLGHDHLTAILATPTRTQLRALDLLGITLTG